MHFFIFVEELQKFHNRNYNTKHETVSLTLFQTFAYATQGKTVLITEDCEPFLDIKYR